MLEFRKGEDRRIAFELPKYPDLSIFMLNSNPEFLRSGSEKGVWVFHGIVGTTSDQIVRESWSRKVLPIFSKITRGGNFTNFQERNYFVIWWKSIGVFLLSFWMSINGEKVFLFPLDKKTSLFIHKKDDWNKSEEELFKWASVSHNFNLFKPTFLEVINHFYGNRERSNEKELNFEVRFNHKISDREVDIFFSPLFETSEKRIISIEVKRNPFPAIYKKNKRDKTKMDAIQFLKGQIKKQAEKYDSEEFKTFKKYSRFQFVAEKLRSKLFIEKNKKLGIEVDKDNKEIEKTLSWTLKRKVYMEDLARSIARSILSADNDKKEKQSQSEEKALWVITPIPFSMKMKNSKDDKFITDKKAQKLYLQWLLSKKITKNLKTPLNFFRFLIISFNESPMVHNGVLKDPSLVICPQNISQEKQSTIWARSGEIILDNLYIKINSSGELDNADLEKKLKFYEKELADLGYEVENIIITDIDALTPICLA